MRYGFTTLRDMGTLDPEWPTINLRDAIDNGIARGPRLFVAAHMISATAGHGDMQGMFPCRCHTGLSRVADSQAKIRELVRMEQHRWQLDQDHEHGRLYERRRRSGQSNVVRR